MSHELKSSQLKFAELSERVKEVVKRGKLYEESHRQLETVVDSLSVALNKKSTHQLEMSAQETEFLVKVCRVFFS